MGPLFGPEMPYVYSLRRFKQIELFLPESFEWLVLRSGLFNDVETQDMLLHPADFIDCEKFFSWEQFFTKQLRELTRDSYQPIEKKLSIPPTYSNMSSTRLLNRYPNSESPRARLRNTRSHC